MEKKEILRELLEHIVKNVVDCPDAVSVDHRPGEQTSLYVIRCDKRDLGKVIGKQGSMGQAIRKIATAFATKHSFRAAVDIEE